AAWLYLQQQAVFVRFRHQQARRLYPQPLLPQVRHATGDEGSRAVPVDVPVGLQVTEEAALLACIQHLPQRGGGGAQRRYGVAPVETVGFGIADESPYP